MTLRVVQLIARILQSDARTGRRTSSVLSQPAAVLRLPGVILCILLNAFSRNLWFTLTLLAAGLFRTALKPAGAISRILRPVAAAVLLAAVFTLPSVFLGGSRSFTTIVTKVAVSVLSLSLMNEEVSWKETTGALATLHLPRVMITTLDLTIRYLVILGRFSHAMLEALSLRRVGSRQWRNAGTGGIAGTTFLKSRQLSQQTTEAMLCRGFTGDFGKAPARRSQAPGRRTANLFYCLLLLALIAFFLYTQAMH